MIPPKTEKPALPQQEHETSRRSGTLLLILLAALTILTAVTRGLAFDLFSTGPPMLENYAKHVYFVDLHAGIFRQTGAFWGYDPTFAAGYLSGSGWSIAFLFPVLVSWLTSLSGAVVIKGMILAYFLLSPLALYTGARWLGLTGTRAAWAGLIGLALDQLTLRSAFVMGSMVGYMSGAMVALPAAAAIHRLNVDRSRPVRSALVASVCAMLVGSLNPYAILPYAAVLAGIWVWHRKTLIRPVGLVALLLSCVAAVVLLWPYLAPGLAFTRWMKAFAYFCLRFLRIEWKVINDWGGPAAFFAQPMVLLLWVAGGLQIVRWMRARIPLGVYLAGVVGGVLAAVGGLVAAGLGTFVFPMRFLEVGSTLMALPAAAFLTDLFSRPGEGRRRRRVAVLVTIIVGLQVLGCILWLKLSPQRPTTAEQESFLSLAEWLDKETTPASRILVESSHNASTQVFGFDFVALLPYYVPDREFVALPTTESPGLAFTTFLMEGILSWIPIGAYTDEELTTYLRTYNVGTIVACSEQTVGRLDRYPHAEEAARIGAVRLYRSSLEPSFFLTGAGAVRTEVDHLVLEDLVPDEAGRVVVSYHWFASLRATDGTPLTETKHAIDPFGFVTILDPPRSLVIENDPTHGFPAGEEGFEMFLEHLEKRYHDLGVRTDVPVGSGVLR